MTDELVRDRIVVGVQDNELRKYLIDVLDLTLHTCFQKGKQYVANQRQAATMGEGSSTVREEDKPTNVDTVNSGKPNSKTRGSFTGTRKDSKKPPNKHLDKQCQICGNWIHYGGRCPAENSNCNLCKGQNRWAAVCKSKKKVSEVKDNWKDEDVVNSLYLGKSL